jgi:APA family basic amino acid/polyamine antiporter
MSVPPDAAARPAPQPALSVFDTVMITVGIVIGAGIFKTPPLVAAATGSPELMLLAWLLGGVLSLVGALCYAELASAYPHAGGDYHFLTRAFGRDASFLFAWARVAVITTGSVALLAFVLGDYLSRVVRFGPHSAAIYAAITVVALTAMNVMGLKLSSRVQNVLTLLQVAGLGLVAVAGWLAASEPVVAGEAPTGAAGATPVFGLAMVFVLLTYGGWNEAAYVSAEVRGGSRAIVRALLISLLVITVAYVGFVASTLHGLGFAGLASSTAVGADVAQAAFGPLGAQLIGAIVGVAALTSINATMIVGARSNYALGRDWPALDSLARWDEGRNTPVVALLLQGTIALALVGFGALQQDGFAAMVEFTAPVFWFFFMLTGVALFVLRRRDGPTAPRPFRVPLYPWLPAVFVATCAYLFYSSLAYAHSRDAVHVCLYVMAVGAAAWLVTRALQAARSSRPPGDPVPCETGVSQER